MRATRAQSVVDIRIGRKLPWQGSFRRAFRSIPRSSDAPSLLKSQQMVARHEQIRQCRHDEQAIISIIRVATMSRVLMRVLTITERDYHAVKLADHTQSGSIRNPSNLLK
jgi:hypothetical protein